MTRDAIALKELRECRKARLEFLDQERSQCICKDCPVCACDCQICQSPILKHGQCTNACNIALK